MSAEGHQELSAEERLKGLAYQFLKLYERWSEDRQALNKNMAEQADMLMKFTSHLKNFERLEPQVRKSLIESIQYSSKMVAEEIGSKVGEAANIEVKKTVQQLQKAIDQATDTMSYYQHEIKNNFLKTTGLTLLTAIAASLLAVWLVMPKPVLPLTGDMLDAYADGVFIQDVWSKLPMKLRKEINDISQKEFNNPSPLPVEESNNSHTNETTAGNNEESWWGYNTLNKK
jgi:hypothetical protein